MTKKNIYKSLIIQGTKNTDATEIEKTDKKIRKDHEIIFNKMKLDSLKLLSIHDKLNYWSSQMTYFTANLLTIEISDASATHINYTGLHEKLYLDRMIEDEIDYLLKFVTPTNRFTNTEQNKLPHESIELDKWNVKTKKLFDYLVEKYKLKSQKQKFINIWYFLSYNKDKDYMFNWSHRDYSYMVKRVFEIEIKKLNKPANYDRQKVPMYNIYNEFLKE